MGSRNANNSIKQIGQYAQKQGDFSLKILS